MSKKEYWLSAMLLLFAFVATAQVDGPLSPATMNTAPFPGSSVSWTNVGNATASDDNYSSFGNIVGLGNYTNYLVATNFGFNIPTTSVITGIVVEIERSDPNSRTADFGIQIVKGGVISTTNRSGGASYATTDTYQTFGNAGDQWGETWTPADINAPDFGVAIAARRIVNGSTTGGRIDHIRITVFYDLSTLPLKLHDFTGTTKGNSIHLNWTSSEESNMLHFDVEKSTDGQRFLPTARIPVRNQAALSTYQATDHNPAAGINYYRLRITEKTGKETFSKTIAVRWSAEPQLSLFPTVVSQSGLLFLQNGLQEPMVLQTFNTAGVPVGSYVLQTNQVPVSSISRQRGWVFYRILSRNGTILGKGSILIND